MLMKTTNSNSDIISKIIQEINTKSFDSYNELSDILTKLNQQEIKISEAYQTIFNIIKV